MNDIERLSQELDGYNIISGIGKKCFSCDRQYERGDTLVVSISEQTNGEWNDPYGGCPDCKKRSIEPEFEETGFNQYVLKIGLNKTPHGLVLDGTSIEILDRSVETATYRSDTVGKSDENVDGGSD